MIEDDNTPDSHLSASQLRQRYLYTGDRGDDSLTASQLRARYDVVSSHKLKQPLPLYDLKSSTVRAIHCTTAWEREKKQQSFLRIVSRATILAFFFAVLHITFTRNRRQTDATVAKDPSFGSSNSIYPDDGFDDDDAVRVQHVSPKSSLRTVARSKVKERKKVIPHWWQICGGSFCVGDSVYIDVLDLMKSINNGNDSSIIFKQRHKSISDTTIHTHGRECLARVLHVKVPAQQQNRDAQHLAEDMLVKVLPM